MGLRDLPSVDFQPAVQKSGGWGVEGGGGNPLIRYTNLFHRKSTKSSTGECSQVTFLLTSAQTRYCVSYWLVQSLVSWFSAPLARMLAGPFQRL